jgi:hypothetical protein
MLFRHFRLNRRTGSGLSNPGLLAISGLLEEMIWPVKDGPLFLGRDSSNQVEVGDGHR